MYLIKDKSQTKSKKIEEGGERAKEMEFFPPQPDLSLQISPPNTKPTSTFTKTDQNKGLGHWIMPMDPIKTTPFDPALLNHQNPNSHLFRHKNNNFLPPNDIYNYQTHQFQFHHQQQKQGPPQEFDYLRPIKGIPIYQNPHPLSFSSINYNNSSTNNISPSSFERSRFLSRFPRRRSVRAPRMRWTTTLHARFVHAVELLGGHESMLILLIPFLCIIYLFSLSFNFLDD